MSEIVKNPDYELLFKAFKLSHIADIKRSYFLCHFNLFEPSKLLGATNTTFEAANGEEISCDHLWNKIVKIVERYGKTKGGIMSDKDLEDLCLDLFLRIWDYKHTFDPRIGRLETWITTIAMNYIKSKFKSEVRRRKNERSFNTCYDDDGELVDEVDSIEDNGQRTEYRAEVNELLDLFLNLTEKWSEKRREIFLLTIKGHKPQEIAELLGMTPNAVSIQLNRGREILKEKSLTHSGFEEL